MLRKGIKLLAVAIILLQSSTAFAQGVLLVNTNLAEQDNKLILDADDTGGDITLQFGNSLSKYLQWDDTNSYFSFNDDLNLQGNELKNFRIDNRSTAPTCDGTAIGRMYHNTTDTETYICNGTSWDRVGEIIVTLAGVQARRNSNFTLPVINTWYDIPLNITDVETDALVLEHNNTNTDRIDVKADGLYRITYQILANDPSNIHQLITRVRRNDTFVIRGSLLGQRQYNNLVASTTATFLAELSNGDFISLQAQRATPNQVVGQTTVSIVKLDGVKGDPGIVGSGTDYNTFTLDQDDTGGDVTLQFGTALSEVLMWDDSASRFYFSDELQVEGDLLPGLDDTYNLGSDSLRWKSIFASEGIEIENGDVIVGEGGFVVFFDNGETGAGNTITVGNAVQIDTTVANSAILTTSKNDQPIGIAVNDSVYGAEVQVVILGKTTVQCTGTVDIGDLIQSSNADGKVEAGNNSTKIIGSALTTCSGGILEAIVHLE